MLLLIKNLHEKNIIEKGKTKETLTARVLIMICTRVTTFNSCYNFTLVFSQGRNFIHVKEKDYAKKTSACPRN